MPIKSYKTHVKHVKKNTEFLMLLLHEFTKISHNFYPQCLCFLNKQILKSSKETKDVVRKTLF